MDEEARKRQYLDMAQRILSVRDRLDGLGEEILQLMKEAEELVNQDRKLDLLVDTYDISAYVHDRELSGMLKNLGKNLQMGKRVFCGMERENPVSYPGQEPREGVSGKGYPENYRREPDAEKDRLSGERTESQTRGQEEGRFAEMRMVYAPPEFMARRAGADETNQPGARIRPQSPKKRIVGMGAVYAPPEIMARRAGADETNQPGVRIPPSPPEKRIVDMLAVYAPPDMKQSRAGRSSEWAGDRADRQHEGEKKKGAYLSLCAICGCTLVAGVPLCPKCVERLTPEQMLAFGLHSGEEK